MSLTLKPTRYAHPEGHTAVCYFTGQKKGLITCGSDGDVRSWVDLMDDDPSASCIAEQATCCISKNEKIYVGNDNNTVQILSYPDLEKSGIVVRFSSTVSCLATTQNSNLIASGGCDMRIQVTDIETSNTIELQGHNAPVLSVTLDPKEEFVASSSGDGTIQIWNIKEKKSVHTWNVVPKCNSFFTAKCLSAPSFDPKEGRYLAYPQDNEVIVTERGSWKEVFRLTSPNIRQDINICRFSECGTRLAACSVTGEIVVWKVDNQSEIGSVEHAQKAKITSFVWHLQKPTELTFCDSLGQLGCIDVPLHEHASDLLEPIANDYELGDDGIMGFEDQDDDDDGENVISLRKLKASVINENVAKSTSDVVSERGDHHVLPEVHLQEPFQPGSTPVHLLSRFMMWNDVGIVKCYRSEDNEESTIEVEFHDTAVHRAIHMNNYLGHTLAALSTEAIALSCPRSDDEPSKLTVVMLQFWTTGSKEWTISLPEDEESSCLAVGTNFVAVATSKRHLRIFMITGIQREVIAIPGSVVAMNALGNQLVVAYHNGVGVSDDQQMSLMWLQIRGGNIKCQTLSLPLSPRNELMWLGLTDRASPTLMDTDGVVRIYSKKSNLWRVSIDTDKQVKGKMDHYFIVGVSEREAIIRCVLCKGSHYPPTTPRATVIEVPFTVPLCEVDSERSIRETAIWKIGQDAEEEETALFVHIAYCCVNNLEHCVVDLCQHVAKQNVIELAIKYATKINRIALAKKLQSIAEAKMAEKEVEEDVMTQDMFEGMDDEETTNTQQEEILLTPTGMKKQETIEIKPLSLSFKRGNPFLKKRDATSSTALDGLNQMPEKPQKATIPTISVAKTKPQFLAKKKLTFFEWFERRKTELQNEFPNLSSRELTKNALERYKAETSNSQPVDSQEGEPKKRKLSDSESQEEGEAKRHSNKLLAFAFTK